MAKDTGHVFDTPEGIELYRLASLKGRIRLESSGIKFKGRSTRSLISAELGLTPRATHEAFLAALQARIDLLKQKILRDRMVVEERGTDFMVMSCDRSSLVMQDLNQTLVDAYFVFYYQAGTEGDAKMRARVTNLAAGMDLAEAWVTEVH